MLSRAEWWWKTAKLEVLLIEDSFADAQLLIVMLEKELPSALVRVCATLEEALEDLDDESVSLPDVVLADLTLPDADGVPIIEAVLERVPEAAVLALTGLEDPQAPFDALAAGASDFLIKGANDSGRVATAILYAVQRSRAEAEKRSFERLALSLLDSMDAPTCAIDQAGIIVATNQAWRTFGQLNGGDDDSSGRGTNYLEICDRAVQISNAVGAAEVAEGIRAVLAGDLDRFEYDYTAHAPWEERWFSVRVRPIDGDVGAVLTHVDVSSIKGVEQLLNHQAMFDQMTGLYNRTMLLKRLSEQLVKSQAHGTYVGIAFLDLDHFKRINDSFGHRMGDGIIRAVADRLADRTRRGDTVARFSGDEFVVIWPDLNEPADAERLGVRLESVFDQKFEVGGLQLEVTASIGVSVGKSPQSSDELIIAADAAMLDAKTMSRGRSRVYTVAMRDRAEARLRMELELKDAIECEQFELHYQPVIDLMNNKVTGVEALVRWRHPEAGLVAPDKFIPIAESSGLIVPLGSWVLHEACRQAVLLRERGTPVQMGVNLSVKQVYHPGIVETIEDALQSSGLTSKELLIEVTESVMMDDADAAAKALNRIAALGVSIAIDDFGTGYSSLLYLKRYPIHAIKVDRSFVAGMGDGSTQDDAIVASVVSLSRAVGAACIAEGVETDEQLLALRSLKCDQAQGYLFSRPVPAHQLGETLTTCTAQLAGQLGRIPAQQVRPTVLAVAR